MDLAASGARAGAAASSADSEHAHYLTRPIAQSPLSPEFIAIALTPCQLPDAAADGSRRLDPPALDTEQLCSDAQRMSCQEARARASEPHLSRGMYRANVRRMCRPRHGASACVAVRTDDLIPETDREFFVEEVVKFWKTLPRFSPRSGQPNQEDLPSAPLKVRRAFTPSRASGRMVQGGPYSPSMAWAGEEEHASTGSLTAALKTRRR